MMKKNENILLNLKSAFVVMLVAIPLCLGIALASHAPLSAGLVSGIIGGIVVGYLGGSELSISGPAAGLSVIVMGAILELQSFEMVCVALIFAGLLQLFLGYMRAGHLSNLFPTSVIEGMVTAIGLIIILKQIPHALGHDSDYIGDESFIQADGANTFTEIIIAMNKFGLGSILISILSLVTILGWDRALKNKPKFISFIPGALLAVILSVLINELIFIHYPQLHIQSTHLVSIPKGIILNLTSKIDWNIFQSILFWKYVITITLIASIESLLTLEATDKIDPKHRFSNKNRELKAQGLANIISGFLGGLPITSVLVRSSTNVNHGATSRLSAIFHGIFILLAIAILPHWLSKIPLSTLATILIIVGFHLISPGKLKIMWNKDTSYKVPFIVTVVAIIFSDLLTGIIVGVITGAIFVINRSYHSSILLINNDNNYLIRFSKDVSFLHKRHLKKILIAIPDNCHVTIDGSRSIFIDEDLIDIISEFVAQSEHRNINVNFQRSQLALHPLFKR